MVINALKNVNLVIDALLLLKSELLLGYDFECDWLALGVDRLEHSSKAPFS